MKPTKENVCVLVTHPHYYVWKFKSKCFHSWEERIEMPGGAPSAGLQCCWAICPAPPGCSCRTEAAGTAPRGRQRALWGKTLPRNWVLVASTPRDWRRGVWGGCLARVRHVLLILASGKQTLSFFTSKMDYSLVGNKKGRFPRQVWWLSHWSAIRGQHRINSSHHQKNRNNKNDTKRGCKDVSIQGKGFPLEASGEMLRFPPVDKFNIFSCEKWGGTRKIKLDLFLSCGFLHLCLVWNANEGFLTALTERVVVVWSHGGGRKQWRGRQTDGMQERWKDACRPRNPVLIEALWDKFTTEAQRRLPLHYK